MSVHFLACPQKTPPSRVRAFGRSSGMGLSRSASSSSIIASGEPSLASASHALRCAEKAPRSLAFLSGANLPGAQCSLTNSGTSDGGTPGITVISERPILLLRLRPSSVSKEITRTRGGIFLILHDDFKQRSVSAPVVDQTHVVAPIQQVLTT